MGLSINLLTPTLGFGSFGIASCTVEIADNGSPITTRAYWFALSDFASQCDVDNTNIASVHFGIHVVNISNADYSSYSLDGTPQASIYALVNAFSDVVANLT